MQIFQKTSKQKNEFDAFVDKVEVICEELEPYSKKISVESIRNIKRNFLLKTDNFFREDRKLNIGVIGRMKAGKSTFINTLLFDGKDILPNAVTPKTATLTKIEYGSQNSLEIDFYTKDEWEVLMQHVNSDIDSNQAQVAKEIISLVEKNDIDPKDFVDKEKQVINYNSHEELMEELQQYVSESGKYTPFVKSTVIYIDNEDLIDMTIVDTPGYDDPIQSRTIKTKDFMELCDVVFFLSKASSFMNHEDIDLFMNQLPNKGVKKMVFVCSRFDDGLRDLIWNCDSIQEAINQLKQKLLTFATGTLNNYKRMHYTNSALVNQNFEPVFVSAMIHNMLKKDKKDYTDREKKIYDDLNLRGDLTDEILKEIANFDCLHDELEAIMDQKDEMLKSKADEFVIDAEQEIKVELTRIKSVVDGMINRLKTEDLSALAEKKHTYSQKSQDIMSKIDALFDSWIHKLDNDRSLTLANMRSFLRDDIQLPEKEGARPHFQMVRKVSGKWYLPWTWGIKSEEILAYNEKYKYLDTADALDNIQGFVDKCTTCIEQLFLHSYDIAFLRHELYQIILDSNDVSDDKFSFDYYKRIVEKTLSQIKPPVIMIDSGLAMSKISNQFYGEMVGNQKSGELKNCLSKALSTLFDESNNLLEIRLEAFKKDISRWRSDLETGILEDIDRELQDVTQKLTIKRDEIDFYQQIIDLMVVKNHWVEENE